MGWRIGENCTGIIRTFETNVSRIVSVDPLLFACSRNFESRCEPGPEMVLFCNLGVLLAVSCSWPVWVSLIHNIFAAMKVEIVFRHDIYKHKTLFFTFETRSEMISHSSVKRRQVSLFLAWNLFSSAYVETLKPTILTNNF